MTTPAITVYTKPNCGQCVQTKNALDMLGIKETQVEFVALEKNPDLIPMVKEKYKAQSAPVVVVDDQNFWSGFNMDKLKAFATSLATPAISPCAI